MIAQTLLHLGVSVYSRERRHQIAVSLEQNNITEDKLRALAERILHACQDSTKAQRLLASLCQNIEKLLQAIEDCAEFDAADFYGKVPASYPGRALFRKPASVDQNEDEEWFDRAVHVRVNSDRHPPQQVAADLGITVKDVEDAIERHRQRSLDHGLRVIA